MNKIIFFVLTLLLSGCAGIWNWPMIPATNKGEIKERSYKKIKLGMSQDEVKECWGSPINVINKKNDAIDQVWVYTPHWKFKNLLYFKNGFLVGGDPDPESLNGE